jgi:exodeoxyribonuclease V alpha subunit
MNTAAFGKLENDCYLTDLDRHFADFILKVGTTSNTELWLAAALVSHYTQEGHVCLDLTSIAGRSVETEDGSSVQCPELQAWIGSLKQSSVVGAPGDFCPLVLDQANRLYLYRYWEYEKELAESLKRRATRGFVSVDRELLRSSLLRLFPRCQAGEIDWQQVAALAAVFRGFCVVAGGPGTGKTSTVVRILALLIEQQGGRKLSIALAAPTGKAAARLKDTVKKWKLDLACPPPVLALIPEEAFTLHRLLGTLPGSVHFRHSRDNPLPYDVIVVDEASMIDLPLMSKLVQAIPDQSRLILLGDKDQLASVEPGAVFGDICSASHLNGFSDAFLQLLEQFVDVHHQPYSGEKSNHVLRDSVIVLKKSYRFDETSAIGRLSQSIHSGDGVTTCELLRSENHNELSWKEIVSPAELRRGLESWVLEAYTKYLKAGSPEEAFSLFETCRVLCSLRKGPSGVKTVNQLVEATLARAGLIQPRGRWYRGQPIMISRNDYTLKLFNGDVGLILDNLGDQKEGGSRLRGFFPAENGTFRSIIPAKLPEHETVYAMTVHKAQGSEFDNVLMLLPDRWSELLTRELIYTGITRARRQLEIWGRFEVLEQSVSKRIERNSGLREALAGDEPISAGEVDRFRISRS